MFRLQRRLILAFALALASPLAGAQMLANADLARDFGDSFRKLGIPVGTVTTSKLYRAQETAKLMNVGEVTTSWDITEGNQIISPKENNKRADALRKLASTPPAAARNNVCVTHKPNVIDAFGKDWFDVKEGVGNLR